MTYLEATETTETNKSVISEHYLTVQLICKLNTLPMYIKAINVVDEDVI